MVFKSSSAQAFNVIPDGDNTFSTFCCPAVVDTVLSGDKESYDNRFSLELDNLDTWWEFSLARIYSCYEKQSVPTKHVQWIHEFTNLKLFVSTWFSRIYNIYRCEIQAVSAQAYVTIFNMTRGGKEKLDENQLMHVVCTPEWFLRVTFWPWPLGMFRLALTRNKPYGARFQPFLYACWLSCITYINHRNQMLSGPAYLRTYIFSLDNYWVLYPHIYQDRITP